MSARVVIDEGARTVTTVFEDGSQVVAAPVYDAESRARADALGYRSYYGDYAVWAMTRDHDRRTPCSPRRRVIRSLSRCGSLLTLGSV